MIAAFASLLSNYPKAQLIIVGEGPHRTELEKQVAGLCLANSVTFTGSVRPEEVPAIINRATLIIIPSRVEGFPMRALEAGQMARPVIASSAGGLAEAIIHKETGLIVECENSSAIADAIAFLLDHPDTAVSMGAAARSRVLKEFSLKSCADSYSGLYRRLVRSATNAQAVMEQRDG